jgi:glyoxylase-like metal-dependent hydrolase (beta-lactamase superfamily II)
MGEIKIGRMVLGACETNCYYIYNSSQGEGPVEVIFVDPADQGDKIYHTLKKKGFVVKGILLTHGHFDHIWGVKELKGLSGADIYAYAGEKELCEDPHSNVSAEVGRAYTFEPDKYVTDGEHLELANLRFRVIATPGHTVGSCCYYFEEGGFLISGDTLFRESVGRTDFPTGSMSSLIRSIKEKLFILPEETKVYPGHGEETTIGYEKRFNPFCR